MVAEPSVQLLTTALAAITSNSENIGAAISHPHAKTASNDLITASSIVEATRTGERISCEYVNHIARLVKDGVIIPVLVMVVLHVWPIPRV